MRKQSKWTVEVTNWMEVTKNISYYLWIIDRVGLFGLLLAPRVARLWIDCSSIKTVRTTGKNCFDVCWVTKCHKPETPGPSSVGIFHDNAVYYFTKMAEISEQSVLRCVPARKKNSAL